MIEKDFPVPWKGTGFSWNLLRVWKILFWVVSWAIFVARKTCAFCFGASWAVYFGGFGV